VCECVCVCVCVCMCVCVCVCVCVSRWSASTVNLQHTINREEVGQSREANLVRAPERGDVRWREMPRPPKLRAPASVLRAPPARLVSGFGFMVSGFGFRVNGVGVRGWGWLTRGRSWTSEGGSRRNPPPRTSYRREGGPGCGGLEGGPPRARRPRAGEGSRATASSPSSRLPLPRGPPILRP